MRLRPLFGPMVSSWIKSSVQRVLPGAKKQEGPARVGPSFRGVNERKTGMTFLGKAVSAVFVMSILGTLVLMVAPDLHNAFCAVVR